MDELSTRSLTPRYEGHGFVNRKLCLLYSYLHLQESPVAAFIARSIVSEDEIHGLYATMERFFDGAISSRDVLTAFPRTIVAPVATAMATLLFTRKAALEALVAGL